MGRRLLAWQRHHRLVARRDDRSPGLRSSRPRAVTRMALLGWGDRDNKVDGADGGRRHRWCLCIPSRRRSAPRFRFLSGPRAAVAAGDRAGKASRCRSRTIEATPARHAAARRARLPVRWGSRSSTSVSTQFRASSDPTISSRRSCCRSCRGDASVSATRTPALTRSFLCGSRPAARIGGEPLLVSRRAAAPSPDPPPAVAVLRTAFGGGSLHLPGQPRAAAMFAVVP
jgi:hypothetical protein